MAIVYEAYQPSLKRTVAIKVLPQQFTFDREFVARFHSAVAGSANSSYKYEDTTSDGWAGRRWVTAIGDWPMGKTVVLEARYELTRQVYDGQNLIAPGLYHQIIYVVAQ